MARVDIKERINILKAICDRYPAVVPELSPSAKWIYDVAIERSLEGKTVEFFQRQVQGLIRSFYNLDIDRNQFLSLMANVISGQLTQAYRNGAADAGLFLDEFPPAMNSQLTAFIVNEYTFVDRLAADILNARALGLPVEPLVTRAKLWANRWNEVYNAAKIKVSELFGGKLEWRLGPTEQHCETCFPLNGKVAFATEWEQAGLRPQSRNLACGGWNCKCDLVPTNKRRSRNVLAFLMGIPKQ